MDWFSNAIAEAGLASRSVLPVSSIREFRGESSVLRPIISNPFNFRRLAHYITAENLQINPDSAEKISIAGRNYEAVRRGPHSGLKVNSEPGLARRVPVGPNSPAMRSPGTARSRRRKTTARSKANARRPMVEKR
jgi:hypothetical protein